MQTIASPGTSDSTTKAMLAGGASAGPIFTAIWLLAASAHADYNLMRHAISSLATGESGWMQIASFIITGLLLVGFSFGLRRALQPNGSVWGPRLIGLVGIGLIGAGIFVTDPLNGYPPGTPIVPTDRTTHGVLHDLLSSLFFLGVPIASFVFARFFSRSGQRGLATYSVLSGIAMLVVFIVARLGFRLPPGPFDLAAYFGVLQRVVVSIGMLWLTWLAITFMRARSDKPAAATA